VTTLYDIGGSVRLPQHPCTVWLDRPFGPDEVPVAVAATFARGGRNFQRTHDAAAERRTAHENESLRATLGRVHVEAAQTEERCIELAGGFLGRKTAILESARETRGEATETRASVVRLTRGVTRTHE